MNNRKRFVLMLTTILLVSMFAAGGVIAYLKSSDSVTNSLSGGNVSIDLSEADYPGGAKGGKLSEELSPLQNVPKNPAVTNNGDNDVIVFIKVVVPVRSVYTANADGTLTESLTTDSDGNSSPTPKNQELFIINSPGGVKSGEHEFPTLQGQWVELTEKEQIYDSVTGEWQSFDDSSYSDKAKFYYNSNITYRTYIFGYASRLPGNRSVTDIAAGISQKTCTLFDSVTYKNIVEGQLNPRKDETDIGITAYGIQADVAGIDTTDIDDVKLGQLYDMCMDNYKS